MYIYLFVVLRVHKALGKEHTHTKTQVLCQLWYWFQAVFFTSRSLSLRDLQIGWIVGCGYATPTQAKINCTQLEWP